MTAQADSPTDATGETGGPSAFEAFYRGERAALGACYEEHFEVVDGSAGIFRSPPDVPADLRSDELFGNQFVCLRRSIGAPTARPLSRVLKKEPQGIDKRSRM